MCVWETSLAARHSFTPQSKGVETPPVKPFKLQKRFFVFFVFLKNDQILKAIPWTKQPVVAKV